MGPFRRKNCNAISSRFIRNPVLLLGFNNCTGQKWGYWISNKYATSTRYLEEGNDILAYNIHKWRSILVRLKFRRAENRFPRSNYPGSRAHLINNLGNVLCLDCILIACTVWEYHAWGRRCSVKETRPFHHRVTWG